MRRSGRRPRRPSARDARSQDWSSLYSAASGPPQAKSRRGRRLERERSHSAQFEFLVLILVFGLSAWT